MVAIGAITNVASAILMEPKIVERIVIVWLGGHALYWPHREFNLAQDVPARIVFDSGVPLVQIPCMGVTTHLHTDPRSRSPRQRREAIGDYLVDIVKGYHEDHLGWSKVIRTSPPSPT